ncbi:MAG: hypothetical protein Q9216_005203 [Gyalolechia sp. 2 TL-2023]
MKRKAAESGSNNGKRARDDSSPNHNPNPSKASVSTSSKQACLACRQRKIRCNTQQPCSYCSSKKKDCVYGPAFKRAQCAQAHVDALEARVRELERSSQAPSDHPDPPNPPPSSGAGTPWPHTNGDSSRTSSLPAEVEARSSTSPLTNRHRRRYGKSSSLHFALNVKASATAMSEDSHQDEAASSPNAQVEDADDPEEEWLLDATGHSPGMSQLLPHRHLAKSLLDKYFEAVHPIWPFLLEHESRELFIHTWTSDEPPESLWMVQLNLIMCLACQQYESEADGTRKLFVDDATTSAKDFYQRAQGYVYANAFTASSVGMLQALLLMALYQQGAMRFTEFYLTIGHAARIAQILGLHISRPDVESVPPQQRELRRRLWWGCFCMDRISSMLCGRPMGIPYGQFSDYQDLLPQQVDDPHIALGQPQPKDTPSVNSFFRHSVRLYHVMDYVLLTLRDAKTTAYFDLQKASGDVRIQTPLSNVNALMSLLTTMLRLDGHLLSWHEYLPPHLQFSLDSTDDIPAAGAPWIQRQRHFLRSRFLGMRILLHRQTILFLLQPSERRNWPQNGIQEWPPLFSDCYSDTLVGGWTPIRRQGVPSPVETTLTHLSAKICTTAATLQIEAVEKQLGSSMIGEWWDFNSIFNALCILSGAMALHRQDLVAVVPNLDTTHSIIQRGLAMIRRVSTNTGLTSGKLRQSERLLEKLVRATTGRGREQRLLTGPVNPDRPPPYSTYHQSKPSAPKETFTAPLTHPTPSTNALIPTFPQPPRSPYTLLQNKDYITGNENQYSNTAQYTQPTQPQQHSPEYLPFPPPSAPHSNGNETNNIPSSSVFDWAASYDHDQTRGGTANGIVNVAPAEEGHEPPAVTTPRDSIPTDDTLGNGFILPENGDSIHALFYHSFDIWSSLDNVDGPSFG